MGCADAGNGKPSTAASLYPDVAHLHPAGPGRKSVDMDRRRAGIVAAHDRLTQNDVQRQGDPMMLTEIAPETWLLLGGLALVGLAALVFLCFKPWTLQ